jgi:cytochrome oxidase Cu insertion factor (SCO1/SenC/PrrC family)
MPSQDPVSAPSTSQDPRIDARTRRGRFQMLMLLLVCASPVIASYLTYYVFRPEGGKTNYGALIDPQRPLPAVAVQDERGQSVSLDSLKGKWLLVSADGASCDEACAKKLFTIRQIRAGHGNDRERIVPVWLITDDGPIDGRLTAAYNEPYAGVRFLRIDRAAARNWLPAAPDEPVEATLYLVDPLGNLMMRYPRDPDPSKMLKDLQRLLRVSRIG